MTNVPEVSQLLGLYTVFILLFVTLGPIKVLGPFMQLTREADEVRAKQIAVRAFALALIAVMVLNLLAMLYARRIMGGAFVLALQIFGAVLGVLQVALAVQMILRGLHDLGVL